MKNITLKEDLNTIIFSRAWKAVTILRKLKSMNLFGKSELLPKAQKIVGAEQSAENLFNHVKLSTREQDKLIFFREEGFIENWN